MDIPMHVKDETLDHANRLNALNEILETITGSRGRLRLASQFSSEQAELEKIHANAFNVFVRELLRAYPSVAAQRYESRKCYRVLTLGLSAQRDREIASRQAREELVSLLDRVRQLQHVQSRDAMMRRVQLLLISSAGQPAILNAALRLLEGFAPEDAAYLRESLGRAAGRVRD